MKLHLRDTYAITVLPSTRHKWTHPTLTPAKQAATRCTYPGEMEGLVDLSEQLHTEMVYPYTDGHPSKLLTRQRTARSQTHNLLITSLTP